MSDIITRLSDALSSWRSATDEISRAYALDVSLELLSEASFAFLDEAPPSRPEGLVAFAQSHWDALIAAIEATLAKVPVALIGALDDPIGAREASEALKTLCELRQEIDVLVGIEHTFDVSIERTFPEGLDRAIQERLEAERASVNASDADEPPDLEALAPLVAWAREHLTRDDDGRSVLRPDREVARALVADETGRRLAAELGAFLDLSALEPTPEEVAAALDDLGWAPEGPSAAEQPAQLRVLDYEAPGPPVLAEAAATAGVGEPRTGLNALASFVPATAFAYEGFGVVAHGTLDSVRETVPMWLLIPSSAVERLTLGTGERELEVGDCGGVVMTPPTDDAGGLSFEFGSAGAKHAAFLQPLHDLDLPRGTTLQAEVSAETFALTEALKALCSDDPFRASQLVAPLVDSSDVTGLTRLLDPLLGAE